MKRFIRKKSIHSILEIIGVFAIIAALFLAIWFLRGYRFVYPEQFSNDWNAISSVGTWAGVVASFVAVWYAVQVADEQNSISMFEKRFDCYTIIQKLLACAEQIADVKTNKAVQTAFRIYFGQPEDILKNEFGTVFMLQLKQKEVTIVAGEFLFPKYNTKMLQEIILTGMILIENVEVKNIHDADLPLSDKAVRIKEKYCRLCKEYEEKYIESMEEELKLNQ